MSVFMDFWRTQTPECELVDMERLNQFKPLQIDDPKPEIDEILRERDAISYWSFRVCHPFDYDHVESLFLAAIQARRRGNYANVYHSMNEVLSVYEFTHPYAYELRAEALEKVEWSQRNWVRIFLDYEAAGRTERVNEVMQVLKRFYCDDKEELTVSELELLYKREKDEFVGWSVAEHLLKAGNEEAIWERLSEIPALNYFIIGASGGEEAYLAYRSCHALLSRLKHMNIGEYTLVFIKYLDTLSQLGMAKTYPKYVAHPERVSQKYVGWPLYLIKDVVQNFNWNRFSNERCREILSWLKEALVVIEEQGYNEDLYLRSGVFDAEAQKLCEEIKSYNESGKYPSIRIVPTVVLET